MKILVVDDDEFIHEVVSMHLSPMGHEMRHAFNSAEALAIVAEEKCFDFLITDIVMPGDDGTKLIRQIHENMPGLPVLAMTGGVENAVTDYVQLAEFFADHTITKPLKKQSLLAGIETALSNAESRSRAPLPGAEKPFDTLEKLISARGPAPA